MELQFFGVNMKKYKLNEDFGGMKAGDVIETDGELGSVFPAGSFELMEESELEVATPEPEPVKRGRPSSK